MLALTILLGFESINNSPNLFLLINVGFLGSLSTFSSFILDLLEDLLNYRLRSFVVMLLSSIFGCLILFYFIL
tara:strand:+ start:807 stop:1025 length:219 start_codon:yes stop_codon:yes gene_type:complete